MRILTKKTFVGLAVLGVLLCSSMPVMAKSMLWTRYESLGELVDGRSVYDRACSNLLRLDIYDDKKGTDEDLTVTGEITIAGGKYTYHAGTKYVVVDGTEKTFDLIPGEEIEKDDLYYEPAVSGVPIRLYGDGLLDKRVSWSLSSGEKGEGTIPHFRTTAEQLKSYVPYVELVKEGGLVTAVKWRVVNVKDTSTPIRLGFDTSIGVRVHFKTGREKKGFKVKGNDILEGLLELPESLSETDLTYIEFRLYEKQKETTLSYRWCFSPRKESDEGVADWGDLKDGLTITDEGTEVSVTLKPGFWLYFTAPVVLSNDDVDVPLSQDGKTLTLKGLKSGETSVRLRYVDNNGNTFVTKKAVTVKVASGSTPGSGGSGGGCSLGFAPAALVLGLPLFLLKR